MKLFLRRFKSLKYISTLIFVYFGKKKLLSGISILASFLTTTSMSVLFAVTTS